MSATAAPGRSHGCILAENLLDASHLRDCGELRQERQFDVQRNAPRRGRFFYGQSGMSDPISLAASGDAEAQADLVVLTLKFAEEGGLSLEEALQSAELVARMAASHGGADQRLLLAGVLLKRADSATARARQEQARAAEFIEEAQSRLAALSDEGCEDASIGLAALLDGLANEGDEEAATRLTLLSEVLGPAVMQRAGAFSRFLHQQADKVN